MPYSAVGPLDCLEKSPFNVTGECARDISDITKWISIDVDHRMATPPHDFPNVIVWILKSGTLVSEEDLTKINGKGRLH